MEWKVSQKTDGKKARAETTVVIPPSPDVLCAGGDAQQKKRPRPRRPRRLAVQGPPGRIFLMVCCWADDRRRPISGATPP